MPEVLYAGGAETATLSATFKTPAGVATDPAVVTLLATAPDGMATTYTLAQLTRTGAGAYSMAVPVPLDGTWVYVWTASGNGVSDVTAGSWHVESSNVGRLYTTLGLVKESLKIKDADSSRDALLLSKITAAARGVDGYCGRRFWRDPNPVTRTFNPLNRVVRESGGYWLTIGGEQLLLPDIASDVGLVVELGVAGGTTWQPITDYETAPDNALLDGKPITSLRRAYGRWSRCTATARVRITALWGWPAVPDVVAEATLLQSTRLWKRKDSPEGVLGNAEWGTVRVARIDPDVQAMLFDLQIVPVGG